MCGSYTRMLIEVVTVCLGLVLLHCGGDGKGWECTENADCGAGEYCNLKVHECAEDCTPDCAGRQCGPDPICGLDCGTCPQAGPQEQVCLEGSCCEPDCAGRECGPDPECGSSCGSCDPGYTCNQQGRCEEEGTGRGYLETCGTPTPGECKQGLVCVTFGGTESYCLYECQYPGGSCPDSGTCTQLQGGGYCLPPGAAQQGEPCELPLHGCAVDLDCLVVGASEGRYCAARCDCTTNVGCPTGTPQSVCFWQDQSTNTCWCGYRCPNQTPQTECPAGGLGWHCENVGSSQPLWACVPD